MSRHFLLSKEAVDINVLEIARWTELQVATFMAQARWGSKTEQSCPYCGTRDSHWPFKAGKSGKRKRNAKPQWKCKHCRRTFSVTTNTPFADHKLSLREYLVATLLFVCAAQGQAALQLRRLLGVTYETAFVVCHKLREALVKMNNDGKLSGEVEIDGGHYCGAPRDPRFKRPKAKSKAKANIKINPKLLTPEARYAIERETNRRAVRGNGVHPNRRIVIVMRERSEVKGRGAGRTIVVITDWEDPPTMEALAKRYIEPNATVITDEAPGFRRLRNFFARHDSVNHTEAYSDEDGVNENQAESFFARGDNSYRTHHRAGPKYLLDYACEWVWREQTREWSNKQQLEHLLWVVLTKGRSDWWLNYKRGEYRKEELMFTGPRPYPPQPASSAATHP